MATDFTHEEIIQINRSVQQWANQTRQKMKAMAPKGRGQKRKDSSGNTKHRPLKPNVKGKNKYNHGLIEAAGFVFPRHGVFVEMGVFGGKTREELMASGGLNPQPWFNPVIEAEFPKLNQKLSTLTEKLVLKGIENLKIKNV